MTRLTFSNITPARVFESSGNNLYYTGSVAIGKSTPSTKLDVSGDVIISGNTTICGSVVVRNLTTDQSVSLDITNPNSNFNIGSGTLFADTTTKRVGIGRTNPSHALDVSGSLNFTGNLLNNGVAVIGLGGTPSQWTTSSSNIYYGGNVGIGTGMTSPATALDVSGVLSVRGNGANNLFIGENHVYLQLFPYGLNAGRQAYIGYPTANSRTFTIQNDASNIEIRSTTNSRIDLINNSTTTMSLINGNVGIGKTNPGVSLDVNGTVLHSNPYLFVVGSPNATDVAHAVGNNIKFNTVITDSHSGYNTATFAYTVPTTGSYLICTTLFCNNPSATVPRIAIRVNSTNHRYLFSMPTGGLAYSGSSIINLAAGQTVSVNLETGTTSIYMTTGVTYHSHMTIKLLG